jgi:hypothetical protein
MLKNECSEKIGRGREEERKRGREDIDDSRWARSCSSGAILVCVVLRALLVSQLQKSTSAATFVLAQRQDLPVPSEQYHLCQIAI